MQYITSWLSNNVVKLGPRTWNLHLDPFGRYGTAQALYRQTDKLTNRHTTLKDHRSSRKS